MELTEIWKYPVKGLTGQRLSSVTLNTQAGVPGDRLLAFAFVDALAPGTDPFAAPWKSKDELAVQNDWPALAALRCELNDLTHTLSLEGPQGQRLSAKLDDLKARQALADFVQKYLHASQSSPAARHPAATELRLLGHSQTRFPDRARYHVSLMNYESLRDLERKTGLTIDMRRMRGNLIFDGIPAWEEMTWKDREIRIGSATLKVTSPIGRCFNINVHPDSGVADMDLLGAMKSAVGHSKFGMMADVIQAGEIHVGTKAQT